MQNRRSLHAICNSHRIRLPSPFSPFPFFLLTPTVTCSWPQRRRNNPHLPPPHSCGGCSPGCSGRAAPASSCAAGRTVRRRGVVGVDEVQRTAFSPRRNITSVPSRSRSRRSRRGFHKATSAPRFFAARRSTARLSIMDDDLTERIADAFARHPWVAKVGRGHQEIWRGESGACLPQAGVHGQGARRRTAAGGCRGGVAAHRDGRFHADGSRPLSATARASIASRPAWREAVGETPG